MRVVVDKDDDDKGLLGRVREMVDILDALVL